MFRDESLRKLPVSFQQIRLGKFHTGIAWSQSLEPRQRCRGGIKPTSAQLGFDAGNQWPRIV